MGAVEHLVLPAYRGLGHLLAPAIRLLLDRRRARGKEHETRWPERFGHASLPRPEGRLVWVHAASVGEAISALPLIGRLRAEYPALHCLMTTGTVTSAAVMAERLPAGVLHQFVPVDLPGAVEGFYDHWRPDLVLWFESELWPTLISTGARRGVPFVLVNGRLSEASYRRWTRVRFLARDLLARFRLAFGQSAADTARFADLGADPVHYHGNLKFASDPLPHDPGELERWRRLLDGRPFWLAASTHPGEELLAAAVHRRLAAAHPGLVTLVVPRHANRGPSIAEELRGSGATVALRSNGDPLPAGTGIYVADTMGELGLWYRLASIVFVGNSVATRGGHNPLEPARLGCAILHGPNVSNFAEITAELDELGAAAAIEDEAGLADMVGRLLAETERTGRMAATAARYAEQEGGALDRIMADLRPLLAVTA